MKKISLLFSFVFHPIFFPVLGTLFYCKYTQNYWAQDYFYLLLFQVVIITFLLPLTFFYLLKTIGKIDTILLPETTQHKMPIFVQFILTLLLIYKSVTYDRFAELFYFFAASCIGLLALFLLLFVKIKASLHLFAMGSYTFFVMAMALHNQVNVLLYLAFLFITTGFIATSRLALKAHNGQEIYIGYLIVGRNATRETKKNCYL